MGNPAMHLNLCNECYIGSPMKFSQLFLVTETELNLGRPFGSTLTSPL